MLQHSEIVYADEIEHMDGSVASVFDPFVVTTYRVVNDSYTTY